MVLLENEHLMHFVFKTDTALALNSSSIINRGIYPTTRHDIGLFDGITLGCLPPLSMPLDPSYAAREKQGSFDLAQPAKHVESAPPPNQTEVIAAQLSIQTKNLTRLANCTPFIRSIKGHCIPLLT